MLTALALTLMAQGTVLHNFNDEEFCDLMQGAVRDNLTLVPPMTAYDLSVDCAAKRMKGDAQVAAEGQAFENYVAAFLASARAGVCDPSNASMVHFAERGWKFQYRFESIDGTVIEYLLTC